MPRRARERATRAKTTTTRRSTGPTQAQRRAVAERAGYRCELCTKALHDGNDWTEVHSFHHRQPRGMGGTTDPDTNSAYQLLLVCGTGTTGCHGHIETNREKAYRYGWLVKRPTDPADVPVRLPVPFHSLDAWFQLSVTGEYLMVEPS